nr:hypothetical protein [Pseudomonas sp. AN-B15]
MNIRERLFLEVDATARSHGLSGFNRFICILIIGAVLLAVLETEQPIAETYHQMFSAVEWLLFGVFLIEYCLRVYIAPMNPCSRANMAGSNTFSASGRSLISLLYYLAADCIRRHRLLLAPGQTGANSQGVEAWALHKSLDASVASHRQAPLRVDAEWHGRIDAASGLQHLPLRA